MRDLTNLVFGKLTVVSLSPDLNRFGQRQWICKCSCGNQSIQTSSRLISGNTKSCGCGQVEARLTHGGSYTAEYFAWSAIKRRCFNENTESYERYGGRGITICDEWRNSFEAFLAHVGPRPSDQHSIDRIDNNKNYEPGNCRWTTAIVQSNNRENTQYYTYAGETKSLANWCRLLGLDHRTIYKRIKRGASFEDATGNVKITFIESMEEYENE